jgi:hypothetical protein
MPSASHGTHKQFFGDTYMSKDHSTIQELASALRISYLTMIKKFALCEPLTPVYEQEHCFQVSFGDIKQGIQIGFP